MSNVKYEITENEAQIESLIKALKLGSPLDVALNYANISKQKYYYWVAIANIVKFDKETTYMRKQQVDVNAGIDFNVIKEAVQEEHENQKNYKSTINAFIEPSKESLLKYQNNKSFREFANKIYDIITRCDQARSDIVMLHLSAIREAAIADQYGRKKLVNTSGSQWFLERTLPNIFGRPCDNPQLGEKKEVEKIEVSFVDPNDKDSKDRVKEMENLVKKELSGEDKPTA